MTINLAWTAPTTGDAPTQYNILRGTASGKESAVPIATVSAPTTTYSDATANDGTDYFYEVTAQNAAGVSAPSNEASATIPLQVPGAPTGLTASAS